MVIQHEMPLAVAFVGPVILEPDDHAAAIPSMLDLAEVEGIGSRRHSSIPSKRS